MWVNTVLAILTVVERLIPIVERIMPERGRGSDKATIVAGQATAVGQTLLPGASLDDPETQALLQAKIEADVALANHLQRKADTLAGPVPTLPEGSSTSGVAGSPSPTTTSPAGPASPASPAEPSPRPEGYLGPHGLPG